MLAPQPHSPAVLGDVPLRVLPSPPVPTLLEQQLEALRKFYDDAPTEPTRGGKFYRQLLGAIITAI